MNNIKHARDEYKVEIILNDEEILRRGFDPASYMECIDAIYRAQNLEKDDDGFYIGVGDGKDWARFGAANLALMQKKWFNIENVKKWYWYELDEDSSEEEPEYFFEDNIKSYKNCISRGWV